MNPQTTIPSRTVRHVPALSPNDARDDLGHDHQALVDLGRDLFAARIAAPGFSSPSLDALAARSGLDPFQHRALLMAMNPRLRIVLISGSAGSGKTRVLATIVEAARAHGQTAIVTAYTGKAVANAWYALRQAGAPQVRMATLHGFRFASVPAERVGANLVIVDEASFLSAELLSGVLSGMLPSARLVMIGDELQLPPVSGTGQPFLDAIRMGLPHVRLRGVHRHRAQPGLHAFANAMRAQAPSPPSPSAGVRVTANVTKGLLRPIVDAWQEGRAAGSVPQCLAWRRTDCDLVNRVIQATAGTRQAQKVFEYRTELGRVAVHLGDRVLITKNHAGFAKNHAGFVYNGLVGTLEGTEYDDLSNRRWFLVRDDLTGNLMSVYGSSTEHVRLGYCLTVHKAQGSGWDRVIVYVPDALTRLTDPGLWHYTAATRARNHLDIVTHLSATDYWADATHRADPEKLRANSVVFNALRDHLFQSPPSTPALAAA